MGLYGQLGDGTNTRDSLPEKVLNIGRIIDIAAGDYHSLAIEKGGTIWSWGFNNYGQLGHGNTTFTVDTPRQVQTLTNAIDVDGGFHHSLGIRADSTVWAWGENNYGQLGNGTFNDTSLPVQVKNIDSAIQVAAGSNYSLALKSDGTVWAWGRNTYGQLGDNSTVDRALPVKVKNLNNVVDIAAGNGHAVAVRADGTVWAWGKNNYGQLGNGTTQDDSIPVQVDGIDNAVAVDIGNRHSLVLTANGALKGFGYNAYGNLGVGDWVTQYTSPVETKLYCRCERPDTLILLLATTIPCPAVAILSILRAPITIP
jgi:alpha-tubulin suppressor-like RCC1 family protein